MTTPPVVEGPEAEADWEAGVLRETRSRYVA